MFYLVPHNYLLNDDCSGSDFATAKLRQNLVGGTGLEPVTSCMSSKRSNQAELTALLNYIKCQNSNDQLKFYMGKEGVEPS